MWLPLTMAAPSTTPTGREKARSACRAPLSRITRPSETGAPSTTQTTRAALRNAQVSTSTFWANIADVHGGAIDTSDVGSAGTMVIWASTFSRNNANNVYTGAGKPGGSAVYLGNHGALWVAANILNGACLSSGGSWYDRGYNIARNSTCLRGAKGDVGGSTLNFRPLAADGGPTKTVVPSKGNPAIGAIPYMTSVRLGSHTITLCPALDQRGQRDKGAHHCDVGSVQSSN